jgi:hypothetical protein
MVQDFFEFKVKAGGELIKATTVGVAGNDVTVPSCGDFKFLHRVLRSGTNLRRKNVQNLRWAELINQTLRGMGEAKVQGSIRKGVIAEARTLV